MKSIKFFQNENNRRYFYRLAIAAMALLTALGYINEDINAEISNLILAVFGFTLADTYVPARTEQAEEVEEESYGAE